MAFRIMEHHVSHLLSNGLRKKILCTTLLSKCEIVSIFYYNQLFIMRTVNTVLFLNSTHKAVVTIKWVNIYKAFIAQCLVQGKTLKIQLYILQYITILNYKCTHSSSHQERIWSAESNERTQYDGWNCSRHEANVRTRWPWGTICT